MASHRYWQLALLANTSNAFSMAEVQFRTTRGVALLFSGGTASATQTWTTWVPAFATDNNISTTWSGVDNTVGQWWKYDYGIGVTVDIVEVYIIARNDSQYGQTPSSFSLQWSDDNVTWTTVRTFAANWTSASQAQTFTVPIPWTGPSPNYLDLLNKSQLIPLSDPDDIPWILPKQRRTTFSPLTDPLWKYVQLLASFNNDLVDASPHPVTITNVGTTFDTTNKKFGTASLNTASGYLQIANIASIHFYDLPFCIEAFVLFPSVGSAKVINRWPNGNEFWFGRDGSNLAFYAGGSFSHAVSWTPLTNTWYHICAERDALNTLRLYVDGTAIHTSAAYTTNISGGTGDVFIGNDGGSAVNVNIDELRVTVGVPRYSGNFTPPTIQFPQFGAIAQTGGIDSLFYNVRFLGHFNSNLTDDSADSRVLTNSGTSFDTSTKIFGSASLNTTGGSVTIPSGSNAFTLGTGQFCLEGFVRFTSIAGGSFISKWGGEWWFGRDAGAGNLAFYYNNSFPVHVHWTPLTNTWYHLCVERDTNNVIWMYVDGVVVYRATGVNTNITATAAALAIGSNPGFVDEVRLTIGVSRYNGVPFVRPYTEYLGAPAVIPWTGPAPNYLEVLNKTQLIPLPEPDDIPWLTPRLKIKSLPIISTTFADISQIFEEIIAYNPDVAGSVSQIFEEIIAYNPDVAGTAAQIFMEIIATTFIYDNPVKKWNFLQAAAEDFIPIQRMNQRHRFLPSGGQPIICIVT